MSRVVVVTGGAKGIGRAVVSRFAALGERVVALGRDTRALEALGDSLGVGAAQLQTAVCDITDEQQVVDCLARLDTIDVLVNNAGIAISSPLSETTLDDWQRHIAVNATGPFLCTRAVLAGMRARDSGAIVTVASTVGRVGARYTAAYAASKHAAVGLMRATAAEVAGSGVRANAVCPAFVATALSERSIDRIASLTGRDRAASATALAGTSPLGRLLDPHEVADAVIWLASEQAATINGQTLVLDGGGIQA